MGGCFWLVLALYSGLFHSRRETAFLSGGQKIHMEVRCGSPETAIPAAVVFLHGSGGPDSPNLPYVDEEKDFQKQGYCVYIPHYLDASGGMADDPQRHYPAWVQVVEDARNYIATRTGISKRRIVLIGYSLGASIALAAATENPDLGAVVDFSGSLPDRYLSLIKSFPPLAIIHGRMDSVISVDNAHQLAELCKARKFVCNVQIYPEEGHVFSAVGRIKARRQSEDFVRKELR